MSRKEPKALRVACFEDGRRKIITFKRSAYWWSASEGAYHTLGSARDHQGTGRLDRNHPQPKLQTQGLFG